MKQKLFKRDFTLVVIGQIISLFGNATIRFALPLYLLNLTGSPALYGMVTACAFIPSILLSPIGGIVADRVNKRNIMVILDFFTAGVILTFLVLMDSVNLVGLLTVTLMLLYGIAGAYQPSVQASIPVLTDEEHFMAANSVIKYHQLLCRIGRTGAGRGSVQRLRAETCVVDLRRMFYHVCCHGDFYSDSFSEAGFGGRYLENGKGGLWGKYSFYLERKACHREDASGCLRSQSVFVCNDCCRAALSDHGGVGF